MASMYRLVRAWVLPVAPVTDLYGVQWVMVSTGDIVEVSSWEVIIEEVIVEEASASTGDELLNEVVAIVQWSGDLEEQDDISSHTKEQACVQPDGNYDHPLLVSWNDTLTATTRGYAKLRNFIHYVVFVSDGTKYYFYHDCSDGISTSVQDLSGWPAVLSALRDGQIYLQ